MSGLFVIALIIAFALIAHRFMSKLTVGILEEFEGMRSDNKAFGKNNVRQSSLSNEGRPREQSYAIISNKNESVIRDILHKINQSRKSGLSQAEEVRFIESGCNFLSSFRYGGLDFFFEHSKKSEDLENYLIALNVLDMRDLSLAIYNGYHLYKSAYNLNENALNDDVYDESSMLMKSIVKKVNNQVWTLDKDIQVAIETYAKLKCPWVL